MNEVKIQSDAIEQQNIIHGDCLEVMRTYADNHFSGVVTDPPYGLKFMGKAWDHGLPPIEVWQEALRICKPGSFMLCFGGTRTYHRLACSIEDAGFEIRDCMMWLYGSGFPKSHNFGRSMGGEWSGFGSALKPAWEPIIVAMKPLDGTFAQNADKWGVAGLNIDASRISTNEMLGRPTSTAPNKIYSPLGCNGWNDNSTGKGRWPANLLLDESAAQQLDQMTGVSKSSNIPRKRQIMSSKGVSGGAFGNPEKIIHGHHGHSYGFSDSGGASRFFYCAKASSSERNEGCEGIPDKTTHRYGEKAQGPLPQQTPSKGVIEKNNHPTVKPLKLMQYLLRLIAPPSGGIILDPFAGSGSTCVAAKRLGIECVGIEKSDDYCQIARARLT